MAELHDIYQQAVTAIEEIDEQLDSLQDSESLGKRKVSNQLIEAAKEDWENFLQGMIAQMDQLEPERRAGVYFALTRGLKEQYDKPVTDLVTEKVESQPKVEPLISQEEAENLSKVRSNFYKQAKNTRELALQIGEATEDDERWKMPRTRRGAIGPRGKRALSLYEWYFNGEAVEDVDTVKDVAKYLGFEKAADFTQALRDSGIDTRNPADEFTWTSPSGVVVTATKVDEEDENGSEDTSDDGSVE